MILGRFYEKNTQLAEKVGQVGVAIGIFNTFGKKNDPPMERENQIYRLTFDVDLPASIGENHALAEAESCCDTYVIPTIDELLSRYDSYNIDIERIALDLGTVRKDEIPQVLHGLLEEEIIKRLYNDSEAAVDNAIRSSDPIETKEFSVNRVRDSIDLRKPFAIGNGIQNETSNLMEPDWMSYLYTGILPWMFKDAEEELSEQVRQEVFSHLEDYGWIMTFIVRLSTDDEAFYRFFNLLDIEEIRMLLSASFFVETGALKNQIFHPLHHQLDDLDKHELMALVYSWMKESEKGNAWIQKRQDEDNTEKVNMIKWRKRVEEQKQERIREVRGEEKRNEEGNVKSKEEKQGKTSGKKGISEEEIASYDSGEDRQIIVKMDDTKRFEDWTRVFDEAVSSMKRQMMLENEEPENHCFADDAGLVILHPFLHALFERLGYLDEERKFISLAMQERAVHLLRWLAGFELPHLDYQMPLEKVLCDLPLTYPIDSDIELTDLEQEEGLKVLRSVCQYWPPLNGTSPEGLQQSFMRRKAIISYEDNTWIVRVEGQTIDILLDDLPWEISLLLFPWKEEMIMVEWQRE